LASWDGEEQALIGSTAYGEAHAANLTQQAVVYINVDSGVSGWNFQAYGTESIYYAIQNITQSVTYPGGPENVWESWSGEYGALGSGSDYTVFIQNLGIASVDIRFANLSAGTYHSTYDSAYLMDTFVDPKYGYHVAVTQVLGLLGLHIADANVLPLSYVGYAFLLADYLWEIESVLNTYNASASVNVISLRTAINTFTDAAFQVEDQRFSLNTSDPVAVRAFNDRLIQTERAFIYPPGLPGRPFYKHVVQAPGFYLGYESVPFPGLLEAVVINNDWDLANQQAGIIAYQIYQAASVLRGPYVPYPPGQGDNPIDNTVLIVSIVVPVGVVIVVIIAVVLYRRANRQYTPVT